MREYWSVLLRAWAPWLLLLPRIAYRRLNPPAESLLTSNVDVLEEVLSHCDAEALSAAMAVCRAWNERGAALLISDAWLARHMDLRTLLLMDAPRAPSWRAYERNPTTPTSCAGWLATRRWRMRWTA